MTASAASPSSASLDLSSQPLSSEELSKMHAYWRAGNYVSAGQIYLCANPLLREPLTLEHIKQRLLGHWGTTPGLNFIYVHLNRLIKMRDLNVIYITGPGHGGPALVANTYLEGSYSEFYPNIPQTEAGMRKLFKQFSFPGGIPSHVAPETPGSIHEGGELGYSIAHAYGAAFDKNGLVPIPGVKLYQIIVGHPARYSGVGDFVAVQMKDRQHRAITRRIQKLVRMPASGQGSRLRFTVSDYATDQQLGVVEGRAVGMRNRIA